MRTATISILLIAAGMAGCIGGEDVEPASTTEVLEDPGNETGLDLGTLPDGTPVPASIGLSNCALETGFFPVPMELAAQMAPEGAQPAEIAPGTSALVGAATSCTDEHGEPADELTAFVPIVPPEGLPESNVTDTVAAIGSLVENERLLAIYEAWGAQSATEAEVTVETLQSTPAARVGHVLATEGDFNVHVYTSYPNQPSQNPASGVRVVQFQEGEPSAVIEVTWPEHAGLEGSATLKLDEGVSEDPFGLVFGNAAFEGAAHSAAEPFPMTVEYVDV